MIASFEVECLVDLRMIREYIQEHKKQTGHPPTELSVPVPKFLVDGVSVSFVQDLPYSASAHKTATGEIQVVYHREIK